MHSTHETAAMQVLFFFAAAVGSGNFPGQQETGEDLY
jgi:hypothetical protein